MNIAQMYGGDVNPPPQMPSQPVSGANTQAPNAQPIATDHRNVAISWVGIVIALVILRVMWEVAG